LLRDGKGFFVKVERIDQNLVTAVFGGCIESVNTYPNAAGVGLVTGFLLSIIFVVVLQFVL